MISIQNANKYFNRFKKNQVHVINNTSLELGDNGLVALLGPSGCGKTTFLNVLGGLDKIGSGKIYINGKKLSSRCSYKVDKMRNIKIGYIFQDYKLVDDLSVYDNVALVLKMIGLKDKKEIKKRVEYVLDKVGMLRYEKRPAGMLSGGERQRVGIARAIVKNPDIILADEPTGNLDSKNSLEVMKIIKAISKDKLVVLVTHEQDLAKFYASRIIEVQDGTVIKDYENNANDTLDYEVDNTFYLKDFKNHDELSDKKNNINIYSNDKTKLNINIVIKNGNIYIQSEDNSKIEVIDDNSSIELVNDSYKKISKDDIDKYDFDFSNLINDNYKKRYSSLFNPISLIINGFNKVFDFPIIKKILLVGFAVSAGFITFSVCRIAKTFDVKDKDFVKYNENYVLVNSKKLNVNDYLEIENMDNVEYVIPTKSLITFKFVLNDYYQVLNYTQTSTGSLSDYSYLTNDDLIAGRLPENEYEVVFDKLIFDNAEADYGNETLHGIGIFDATGLVGREITFGSLPNKYTIVGISDLSSPCIYTNRNQFNSIIAYTNDTEDSWETSDITSFDLVDYNLISNRISLKEGRLPSNDYEVIVNYSYKDVWKINTEISHKVNDRKLVVVGYYTSSEDINTLVVNSNTVKYNMITEKSNLAIYTYDKDAVVSALKEKDYNAYDSYLTSKNSYLKSNKKSNRSIIIASLIMLIISFVEIYLMIRSSFLSRIKEVGIYRAIGVKKLDIYKMFFGEIFAITTLASVPGALFMAYAISLLSQISYLKSFFMINIWLVILSLIIIYLFNLIIGLLPVYSVIRKTPAQILARTDLD